jgi:hypothetical protein
MSGGLDLRPASTTTKTKENGPKSNAKPATDYRLILRLENADADAI